MCLPLAAIGAIAGVASAGAGFIGQRQQAKAQAAYQAQSAAAEQQRALQEQSSIRMQQAQQKEATARELEQVSKKSQEALARARVSAGEAGVSGLSVQALMDDYVRQQAGLQAAVTTQEKLYGLQTGMSLQQIGLASQQEILGLSQPINRPSLLLSGLQAVSGGLSGYAAGQDISSRMAEASTTGITQTTAGTYRGGSGGTMASGGYSLFGGR